MTNPADTFAARLSCMGYDIEANPCIGLISRGKFNNFTVMCGGGDGGRPHERSWYVAVSFSPGTTFNRWSAANFTSVEAATGYAMALIDALERVPVPPRAPLDGMAPGIRSYFEDIGAEPEMMGGGGWAMRYAGPFNSSLLITGAQGMDMPDWDDWMVGVYVDGWDGEDVQSFRSTDRPALTLKQAMGAGCGILAASEPVNPTEAPPVDPCMFSATVRLLIKAESPLEAAEGISETLRDIMLNGTDWLIDWEYDGRQRGEASPGPVPNDGATFAEFSERAA